MAILLHDVFLIPLSVLDFCTSCQVCLQQISTEVLVAFNEDGTALILYQILFAYNGIQLKALPAEAL